MANSMLVDSLMDLRTRKLSRMLTGIIVYSNPKTHLYDVKCDDGSEYPSIPLASPYVNSEFGQGQSSVAKIGTRCLVAVTENLETVIIGCFVPVGTKVPSSQLQAGLNQEDREILIQKQANSYEGRAGNRTKDLDVDDQETRGPLGNAVRVRASGAVEVISQDAQLLTRWLAIPGENSIISLADLIDTILPSGRFVWKSDIKNKSGYLSLELKSDLNSDDPDIFIKAGQLPEGDIDEGNSLVVTIKGESELKITYDGNELKIKTKDLRIEADGNINVKSKTATVEASSEVKIKGSTIELN